MPNGIPHQGRFLAVPRLPDAMTARAGSGARTVKLARRASAMDGASNGISRGIYQVRHGCQTGDRAMDGYLSHAADA